LAGDALGRPGEKMTTAQNALDYPKSLWYMSSSDAPCGCVLPKLINPERAMESATNREVEILTAVYADERGSGMGAETHKPRMEAGKQEEPLDCGMGSFNRPHPGAARGHCGLQNAKAKGLSDRNTFSFMTRMSAVRD